MAEVRLRDSSIDLLEAWCVTPQRLDGLARGADDPRSPVSSPLKNSGVSDDDWRRLGQVEYLKGKVLAFGRYTPPRADWDHDHCEFCNGKFSLRVGDLAEGYSANDGYYWICADCYGDFREEFGWTVRSGS